MEAGLHLHGMFAGRFLCCLGAEADCERLFSAAKHTINETRCRLDPETDSDCIFCSENLELLSKDSRHNLYCDSLGKDSYGDSFDSQLSRSAGSSLAPSDKLRVLNSQVISSAPSAASSQQRSTSIRSSVMNAWLSSGSNSNTSSSSSCIVVVLVLVAVAAVLLVVVLIVLVG